MKKILSVLILTTILVFPMLVLAQSTTILEKCTLRHDLGKAMCRDYTSPEDLLQKGWEITAGGDEVCCELTAAGSCSEGGVVCLLDFVNTIADWVFAVFLVIAVIFLVMAAIQFVTAGGNPEGVTQARTKIIYAVVGLAVAFVARGIVNIIEALVA